VAGGKSPTRQRAPKRRGEREGSAIRRRSALAEEAGDDTCGPLPYQLQRPQTHFPEIFPGLPRSTGFSFQFIFLARLW
jgi:hypothetical protein